MKLKVYNLNGEDTKTELDLNPLVFGVKVKPEVVHEVFLALANAARKPIAHAKDRSEVRGGGRKPWRQKGTGRARHGSTRSPIWKGGGVTFGPLKTRNFKTKVNKKIKQLATKMCLSDKVANNAILVVDNFDFKEAKTKIAASLIAKLPTKHKSFVMVVPEKNDVIKQATNNLPKVKLVRAQDLNVNDLVNLEALVASTAAIKKIEERFTKKDTKTEMNEQQSEQGKRKKINVADKKKSAIN